MLSDQTPQPGDVPPAEEPIPPLSQAVIHLMDRTGAYSAQAEAFGTWFNAPQDMEGVATRILSMVLMFAAAVSISLTLCTIALLLSNGLAYLQCVQGGGAGCALFPG